MPFTLGGRNPLEVDARGAMLRCNSRKFFVCSFAFFTYHRRDLEETHSLPSCTRPRMVLPTWQQPGFCFVPWRYFRFDGEARRWRSRHGKRRVLHTVLADRRRTRLRLGCSLLFF